MSDYSIVIQWSEEDQEYVAIVPELPGVSATGASPEEAATEVREASIAYVDSLKEEELVVPKPRGLAKYSGQIRLRMPRDLHARLSHLAEQEGMSLNSYIIYLIGNRAGQEEQKEYLFQAIEHQRQITNVFLKPSAELPEESATQIRHIIEATQTQTKNEPEKPEEQRLNSGNDANIIQFKRQVRS